MGRRALRFGLVLCLFLSLAGQVSAGGEKSAEDWRFMLSPFYLWGVGIDGEATIPGQGGGGPDIDLGFGAPFSNLSAAFSFHFEAGRDRWNLFADYLTGEWKPETSGPAGLLGLQTTQSIDILELGGTWLALSQPPHRLDVVGGARYSSVGLKVTAPVFGTLVDESIDVWDVFGGMRGHWALGRHVALKGRADLGGGGSDFVWNANLLADWRFSRWGSMYGGYRWLSYDLEEPTAAGPLSLDILAQGPVLGLAIHW